ncbi:MAG TPA: hypothetical protein VGK05_00485 [Acidimicrobiia bacterium]|jgi:hypothetical protein
MIQQHLLDLHDVWSRRFDRYATLQHRSDQRTIALFVRPLGSSTSAAPAP